MPPSPAHPPKKKQQQNRPSKAQAVVGAMKAATRQLQLSETFKRFDDGFTPTYMVAMQGACVSV
jgi:hypothetical protein